MEGSPGTISVKFCLAVNEVLNGVEIAENFNRLSRAHERYRQTDRQTTDRRTGDDIIANVNVSSPALKCNKI